jgi:hypothetical protein
MTMTWKLCRYVVEHVTVGTQPTVHEVRRIDPAHPLDDRLIATYRQAWVAEITAQSLNSHRDQEVV